MATITNAGAVPASPQVLRNDLVAAATALSPGLTADLPGSLIEDLASTGTGGLVIQDAAYVDLVNSVSPLTANDFILNGLGNVYGVQRGVGSNTSVYVTFTGTPGFVVNRGFIVGDGVYQYTVQDGGVINGSGVSPALYCLATVEGSWAIPANTVTQLITSIPSTITLTCDNADPGLPGDDAQSIAEFRAQVIQAGQAVSTGMATFLKTQLQNVSGVKANLISVRQTGGGWQVLVGGGDPYSVAYAIFMGLFNIIDLEPASAGGTTTIIDIYDFPDFYSITYVQPVQQDVQINVTWNTSSTNLISNAVVAAAAQPALADYINNIYVGQPISTLELQNIFEAATASVLPLSTVSKLQFQVIIDGSTVTPPVGGVLISGDPEGFFATTLADIVVTQG